MPVDYDDDNYNDNYYWDHDHSEYIFSILRDLNFDRKELNKIVKLTQKTELYCDLQKHRTKCKACDIRDINHLCSLGTKIFNQWTYLSIP